MKIVVAIVSFLLLSSLYGCISAKVDARDASKEWAEVGKSWAEAFKDEGQGKGESQ